MRLTSLYSVLGTTDVAASRRFYERHLGFRAVFDAGWYVPPGARDSDWRDGAARGDGSHSRDTPRGLPRASAADYGSIAEARERYQAIAC